LLLDPNRQCPIAAQRGWEGRVIMMIEREDVQTVLRRWFPDAPGDTIDSATSQILGLTGEWVEVTSKEEEMGYHYSSRCSNICYLADQVDHGAQFRLFLRRAAR
jgi:hypothetical protein